MNSINGALRGIIQIPEICYTDYEKGEEQMSSHKEAKYNVSQIADWLLLYNQANVDNNEADLISNLKMQKLLYYAQGTSLAFNGYPLFNEPILSWTHGPIVRKAYDRFSETHDSGIQPQGFCVKKPNLDSIDEALLEAVYNKYNRYSAWELVHMTHQEDPWKNTKQNEEIPLSVIEAYFKNTLYKKVFDGTLFDDIPTVEPLYRNEEGVPVFPAEQ